MLGIAGDRWRFLDISSFLTTGASSEHSVSNQVSHNSSGIVQTTSTKPGLPVLTYHCVTRLRYLLPYNR
eukprot:1341812-Amorphochlora_amoeboformis.AAC.1